MMIRAGRLLRGGATNPNLEKKRGNDETLDIDLALRFVRSVRHCANEDAARGHVRHG
jgi:hypothetical protein